MIFKEKTKKYTCVAFAFCALLGLQAMPAYAAEQQKPWWHNWKVLAGGGAVLGAAATVTASYFVRRWRHVQSLQNLKSLPEFVRSTINEQKAAAQKAHDAGEESRVAVLSAQALLHEAEGNLNILKYANPFKQRDLLIEACAQNKIQIVNLLLERYSASLTSDDHIKAIIAAAKNGHEDSIKSVMAHKHRLLQQRYGHIGLRDRFSINVYDKAMSTRNPDVVASCYRGGVWTSPYLYEYHESYVRHNLEHYINAGDLVGVECCLAAGFDPQRCMGSVVMPLALALNAGHYEIAKALLRKKPNLAKLQATGVGWDNGYPLMNVATIKGVEFLLTLPVDQRPDVSQVPKMHRYPDSDVEQLIYHWAQTNKKVLKKYGSTEETNDIRDEQGQWAFIRGINATKNNPEMCAAFTTIMRVQLPAEQQESLEGQQFFAALGDQDAQLRLAEVADALQALGAVANDPTLRSFLNANPFVPTLPHGMRAEKEWKLQRAGWEEDKKRLDEQVENAKKIDIKNARRLLFKYGIDSTRLATYLHREHGKVNLGILGSVMFELGITADNAGKLIFQEAPRLFESELVSMNIDELPIIWPSNLDPRLKRAVQFQMLDNTLDSIRNGETARNTGRALITQE